MMYRIIVFVFTLMFVFADSAGAQIAEGYPGCLVVDLQDGVTCGGGTSFFGENTSGQFEVNNIDGTMCCGGSSGGDTGSYFQFEELDISCYTNITISMDYSASSTSYEDDSPIPLFGCTGNSNPDNSHDQIVFTYILDGNPEVLDLYVHGTTQADFTGNWSTGPLNGNTLTIKVYASNKASAEAFYFENLVVDGTQVPLSAGPDDSICDPTSYSLQGTGCGQWSGGTGSFSDINDPTATYTVGAGETGMITLTFQGNPVNNDCNSDFPSDSDDVILTIANVDATDPMVEGCSSDLMNFDLTTEDGNVNATETVTWYNGQPSSGGTLISPATNVDISTTGGIDLWALVTNSDGCTEEVMVSVAENTSPTGQLSGAADLCPGDCIDIDVDFTGGTSPYILDVTLFTIATVSIPGFEASDRIKICFDTGGPLFDSGTNTFDVPNLFPFLGDFTLDLQLNALVDDEGCDGIVIGGPINISFNQAPEIIDPGEQSACDNGDGTATYDLDGLDNTINDGTGLDVTYFSDPEGVNEIFSLYTTTPPTTIYAVVNDNPCNSDTIPIDLVLEAPNATVTMYCDDPMETECTFCIDPTLGYYLFDPIVTFSSITNADFIEFTLTDADGVEYSTMTFGSPDNDGWFAMQIDETTTFTVTAISGADECFDPAEFPEVTVYLIDTPEFDDPGNLEGCPSITLPDFTNVSDGAMPSYFTEMGGMGTEYMPGDVITSDLQLYAYYGAPGCELEYSVFVDIQEPGILAPIDDVNQCMPYTLPPIDGVGIVDAFYYDMPGGMGTVYMPGDIITSNITLYAYAPCGPVEESFDITIEPGGSIDAMGPVDECGSYTLPEITGTNVTDALYYTESGGMGTSYMAGDAILMSITLYMYSECATNEETLIITINSGPVFEIGDTTACEFYIVEPIVGTGTDGDELYFTLSGGMGMNVNVGDTIFTDSTYYLFDPLVGCEQDIPINITIRQPYSAGVDTLVNICEGDDTNYISYDLLGGADTVGFWINFNTFDTLGVVDTFNFSTFATGQYNYIYVIEDSICMGDDRLLTVQVSDSGASAGPDLSLNLCSSDDQINFDNAVATFPLGGAWNTIIGGDTTATDISLYLLADQTAGVDTFLYEVDGGDCGSDDALLIITIEQILSAGDDVPLIICGDQMIMLEDQLINNDAVGTFFEPGGSGGLTGNVFNTTGLPDAVYTIEHTVTNTNCPDDVSLIIINKTAGPTAGSDVTDETCNNEVNLFEYLAADADNGGTFYFEGTEVSNGLFTMQPGQTRMFQYQVGDGVDCPIDEANITISFADVPDAFFIIPLNFCYEECRDLFIVVEDIDSLYMTITDGTDAYPLIAEVPADDTVRINLCNIDDGIFDATNLEPNMVYNIFIDSLISSVENCTFESNLMSSDIMTNVYAFDFVEFFCSDTMVMIGDQVFTDDFTGLVTIPDGGQFGCDSIVNVDINFGDINFGNITYTACAGLPFTDPDFGEVWTEMDNMRDVLIPGGGSTGCDSIVAVTVNFTDAVIEPYPEMICEEDSITILGTIFWAGNTNDTINTGILSQAGCDSLIAVELSFFIESPRVFAGPVCENYTEELAPGIVLSSANFGEEFIIGQTDNGCDSVIINQYEYILPAASSTIDTSVCDASFSIPINGPQGVVTFDIDNPSGQVDYPAQDLITCDSTVFINIIFGEMAVDIDINHPTCALESNGIVVINSISDPGPYSYTLDGGLALFETVPLQVFPDTDSGVLTVTSSVTGCSTDIPYEFDPVYMADYSLSLAADSSLVLTETNDTPYTSIVWSPTTGLSCIDCENPMVNPTETTTYIATITYDDGCVATAEITIEVPEVPEPPSDYYFPNIFRPSSTSGNNTFAVVPSTNAKGIVSVMRIYDRWGNLVFSENDPTVLNNGGGWDGLKGGSLVESGVYLYVVQIIEEGGLEQQPKVITEYGDVTVLR